jgi:putative membrane protein
MRQGMKAVLAGLLFAVALSCGKNQADSKELAEEQNEEKLTSVDIKQDMEFVVTAADGGLLEVQLGQLAVANAKAAEIKKFGQSMVDDHGKANEELKTLAQQKDISIPTALSEKSQKKYEELARKSGTEFDKEYIDFMVKDHKDVIDHFKQEAENGKDSEISSWASGKVSILEHHLMMAEDVKKMIDTRKK